MDDYSNTSSVCKELEPSVQNWAIYAVFGAFVLTGILSEYGFNTLASLFDSKMLSSFFAIAETTIIAIAFIIIAHRRRGMVTWQVMLAGCAFCIYFISNAFCEIKVLMTNLIMLIMICESDLDDLCKSFFIASIAAVSLLLILTSCGIGYNRDEIPNGRLVFAYGLRHPNSTAALLLSAMCSMAYYYWDKRSWPGSFVMSAICAGFSYLTLSSNAATVLLMLLSIAILLGHTRFATIIIERHSTGLSVAVILTVLVLFMLMFFGTIFYSKDNTVWSILDNLTHSRIMFSHGHFIQNDGFTLFGRQSFSPNYLHTGEQIHVLDSGYSRLSLIHGLASAVVIFLMYLIANIRLSKSPKYICVIAIFTIYALHMLIETHALYLCGCFAVVFLSSCFSDDPNLGRNQVHGPQRS